MTAKSIAKSNKSKNFTFRITDALSNDIAELKAKCAQHGVRFNVTEALTAALEKEIKAVQKHIQTNIDSSWAPGQMDLPVEGADANTK